MQFDRFRAYTKGASNRNVALTQDGQPVLTRKGAQRRIDLEWEGEHVAFEGEANDGKAAFNAGDIVISKVVFYTGGIEDEVVCGDVEVNASGKISVSCPDDED